jgi:hypothetical protein
MFLEYVHTESTDIMNKVQTVHSSSFTLVSRLVGVMARRRRERYK